MSIVPWLITWEIVNEHNPIPNNLIAAILPNRISISNVRIIMYLLYHNEGGYLSEQLRFARHQYGHKVHSYPPQMKYYLGSSPFLFARRVFNFKLQREVNGDEIATWDDHDFDEAEMRSGSWPTFVWVRRRTYRKSSGKIACEPPVRGEIPRRDRQRHLVRRKRGQS
jgi:hypothetical protein